MGTNYYMVPPRCPHCRRHDGRVHIGKSSHVDGARDDVGRCLTLEMAIDKVTGLNEGYRSDGLVAVYQLVKVVKVRYTRDVEHFPVRELLPSRGKKVKR